MPILCLELVVLVDSAVKEVVGIESFFGPLATFKK